ncbi:hypothetical protein GUJ93_ZPchr0444g28991 [Zizania palustris]|uniref:Uncharacterized protein n=1 Tax=Zizania palustris TaxID=103762 RepID=A0A8J5X3J0_ZIZPA|nr:hypothetical protein GUJ93_ZPchr0444g28991 [Zizania palustris]
MSVSSPQIRFPRSEFVATDYQNPSSQPLKLPRTSPRIAAMAAPWPGWLLQVDSRDSFVTWMRGEFAAANAIIDLLLAHIRDAGGHRAGVRGRRRGRPAQASPLGPRSPPPALLPRQ